MPAPDLPNPLVGGKAPRVHPSKADPPAGAAEATVALGTYVPVSLRRRLRRYAAEGDEPRRVQDVVTAALDAYLRARGF